MRWRNDLTKLPPIENSKAANPVLLPNGETYLKQLASMLYREHVCIEIGNPLLALLRDSKVAQGISDIGPNRLPEEIWIVSSLICDAIVFQFIDHSGLAKLVK
jgi:hypothetical protein